MSEKLRVACEPKNKIGDVTHRVPLKMCIEHLMRLNVILITF